METSTYNSSIHKKMNRNDGEHKPVHRCVGFSVYLQLRGSIRPQGTKRPFFVGGPDMQFSDRYSDAFCYYFSFRKVLKSQAQG